MKRITEKDIAEALSASAHVLVTQPEVKDDDEELLLESLRRIPLSVFFKELYDARNDTEEAVVHENVGDFLRAVAKTARAAPSVADVGNMLSALTHSTLNTSKRIGKYLTSDTTADHFVRAQADKVEFIEATTAGTSQQLKNSAGKNLYWVFDPSGATVKNDGMPYIEDNMIPMTSVVTTWPVMVYVYTETILRSIRFESIDGEQRPVDTFGTPSANGWGEGRTFKSNNGLIHDYTTSSGQYQAIEMGEDGYMDLVGQRKPLRLDFSNWDNGFFVENLDGIIEDIRFELSFDELGRPVSILDETGHETVIVW